MRTWVLRVLTVGLCWFAAVNAVSSESAKRSQPSAEVDWAAAARMDIEAVHDTLRDHHPGPVDAGNPAFAKWLKEGRAQALEQAATAAHSGDYWRAVRGYTNGFRDGHIGFWFNQPMTRSWPGLLTVRDAQGRTRVVLNDEEPSVTLQAELLACDGHDADALQRQAVDPYRWNVDIPHERNVESVFLMTAIEGDPRRPRVCRFRANGREFEFSLRWSSVSEERLFGLIDQALGRAQARIGLHQVGDVWFVSLPTFDLVQPQQVDAMRALIRDLRKRATSLRAGPWLVLDVRGNTGGNSGWGSEVAAALFGKKTVDRIEGQFDWTVDWRASKGNAASLRQSAAQSEKHGQLAEANYRRALAAKIEQAAAAGIAYVRQPAPARLAATTPTGNSPFKGRVYLLTDHACASACLDFADIVRRLPGVVHVGLPTSADSIYIDNTGHVLPSGLGVLSWSLKVYRNRIRGNNQWYEPAVPWPGGAMTDEAVATWVRRLNR
jgi:Peptidase family S41